MCVGIGEAEDVPPNKPPSRVSGEEHGDDAKDDCEPWIEYEREELLEGVEHRLGVPMDRHPSAEVRREAEWQKPLTPNVPPPREEVTQVVAEVMAEEGVLRMDTPEEKTDQSQKRQKPPGTRGNAAWDQHTRMIHCGLMKIAVPPFPLQGLQHPPPEVILAALLVGFFILKLSLLETTIGDQGVYEYAAMLWVQGILPHRDFFFSHPPMHLLTPALTILVTGVRLPVLDMLPSFLGILSSILLFSTVRKNMGATAALLASALFLFSYAHLVDSSHLTGVEIALLTMLLSIFLYDRGKAIAAGVALSITLLSGLYAAPAILTLLFVAALEERRSFVSMTIAFVTSSVLLHGIYIAIFGDAFLEQVYLYHLAKTGDSAFFASKAAVFQLFMVKNALLLFIAFGGVLSFFPQWLTWRHHGGEEERKMLQFLRLCLAMLAAFGCSFLAVRSIFTHYLLLTVPFLAVTASFFLLWTRSWWREGHRMLASLPMFVVIVLHGMLSLNAYLENRERKRFDGVQEITAYVAKTLGEAETLYGDFAIVPTIAMLSGRRIAAREIDSSIERFTSGVSSLEETIAHLEGDRLRLIVSRPHRGIVIYPPFREYLTRNYRLVRQFNKKVPGKEVEAWRRME